MNKKTLVLGASSNPQRYSNMAIKRLLDKEHAVRGIGRGVTEIHGILIDQEMKAYEKIHTVTMYLKPSIQEEYINFIISLQPQRIIFNPGAENDTFYSKLRENDIEVIEACTLVMLSNGLY